MNRDTFIAKYTLLLTANSADTSHSGQSFCLWSTKNLRYCSNSWFIYSVCLPVYGWKDVNNLVLIPNILFSSLVISTANCGPLSNTTLSSNPYSFYTLFLNDLTNPSTDVSSVVATKCVILDNLSQTTRIVSFLATNSNFIIKSIIRYVYSFFSISLNFNFPAGASILFFILWYILQPSTYLHTS